MKKRALFVPSPNFRRSLAILYPRDRTLDPPKGGDHHQPTVNIMPEPSRTHHENYISAVRRDTEENRQYWDGKIKEQLIGRRIVDARYLTREEQESFGWYRSGVVLFLGKKGKEPNDTLVQVVVMQDSEGNGPGCLDIHRHTNKDGWTPMEGGPVL